MRTLPRSQRIRAIGAHDRADTSLNELFESGGNELTVLLSHAVSSVSNFDGSNDMIKQVVLHMAELAISKQILDMTSDDQEPTP